MKAALPIALVFLAMTGCAAVSGEQPATTTVVSTATPDAAEPASSPEESAAPASDVVADGAEISAELTRAGQRDTYPLDLGEAREFYVTDMSGDGIEFQIVSEVDGEPISPSGFAMTWGSTVVKLTKTGTHRLEVYGQTNVVGPYSFRVATVKVRDIPTTIGLSVNGQLDVPGRIDRYEFDSGGATAIKLIGGNGACQAIELELVDAAEKSVATARQPIPLCGYEAPIPLANGDGKYALVVRSGTAKTGGYTFQLAQA
ncbi:hypothetical protein FDA94_08410 [Herbidospora galbida]|uniref:Peptidase C-terminal archaeal/bacterial domain-containing protein n=1 Tax=Herbidospora galbida TaxID=2575442 RepID=A0A4U3MM42_9ACTN|nr:hypothetical protein [Herbidospora galbida]TKK89889.1 hypothetical protein FDA94_08410 [Herbidospora galbida]